MDRTFPIRAIAAAAAFVACGCTAEAGVAPADVAVRVNGGAIPMQQVHQEQAHGDAFGQALERAIDRELLAQKAVEEGLHRDARIGHRLEAARRAILSDAWLDKSVHPVAQATPEEVGAFYAGNPELFSQRRIYGVQELVVADPGTQLAALRRFARDARALAEVEAWLADRGIAYRLTASRNAAEDVALARLPRLSTMRDGDIAVFEEHPGAAVVRLADSAAAPLTQEEAAPAIEQFIVGRKRIELARREVGRLREQAKIEYVGDHGGARVNRASAESPATPFMQIKATHDATARGIAAQR